MQSHCLVPYCKIYNWTCFGDWVQQGLSWKELHHAPSCLNCETLPEVVTERAVCLINKNICCSGRVYFGLLWFWGRPVLWVGCGSCGRGSYVLCFGWQFFCCRPSIIVHMMSSWLGSCSLRREVKKQIGQMLATFTALWISPRSKLWFVNHLELGNLFETFDSKPWLPIEIVSSTVVKTVQKTKCKHVKHPHNDLELWYPNQCAKGRVQIETMMSATTKTQSLGFAILNHVSIFFIFQKPSLVDASETGWFLS